MKTMLPSRSRDALDRYRGSGELLFENITGELRMFAGQRLAGLRLKTHKALDLGPGPQQFLFGDLEQGYLGTMSTAELTNPADLSIDVGLSDGSLNPTAVEWLKFADRGRILYTPTQYLRNEVSWESLYQAGLVYGRDEDPTFPSPEDVRSSQLNYVIYQGAVFKVRLLTGFDEDPVSNATLSSNSEWERLLYKVSLTAGGEWASYTDTELGCRGYGRRHWVQESSAADPDQRYYRGDLTIDGIGKAPTTSVVTYLSWRPVLEWVPK